MQLRNIAIIAHVDHGKTTLVDCLLRQSGSFRDNQHVPMQALDSNALERERGITILAKCTSVVWRDVRINIVDTPGHADFGGEVERIMSMVDGALVLVDAAEGPMPQTKFVLGKALALGLRPIVIVNKVDKPEQRALQVQNETFDLFAALGADETQLDFPTLFGSAKKGWAAAVPTGPKDSMAPLFDLVVGHVAAPAVDETAPFCMLATTLEYDPYVGRLLTGRISAGSVHPNMIVHALSSDGTPLGESRVSKLLAFRNLKRIDIEEATAGDIVAVAGIANATVADTICAIEVRKPLPAQPINPPTLAMTFSANDSPLSGQEGDIVTARQIWSRLEREGEGNVAIRITKLSNDEFEVAGRGELQLAVLVETMRREGYELAISRPRVLLREVDGQCQEPIEEVVIDVDEEYTGAVVEKLGSRRADFIGMSPSGAGKARLVFHAPSRGLIGYLGEFLTDTRGTGIMNRVFRSYAPYKGGVARRRSGVLVSTEAGPAVAYALWNLEERGPMFIKPNDPVYPGMLIGEHSRGSDLDVNPRKAKQLTNIRAAGKDDAVSLRTPIHMTLDKALTYIEDDELVEVTPKSVRLRKRERDPIKRRREAKTRTAALQPAKIRMASTS